MSGKQRRQTFGLITLFLLLFLRLTPTNALPLEPKAVFARVIDSGAALSVAIIMPDNHYMIYDAANYVGGGSLTFKTIKELGRKDL